MEREFVSYDNIRLKEIRMWCNYVLSVFGEIKNILVFHRNYDMQSIINKRI